MSLTQAVYRHTAPEFQEFVLGALDSSLQKDRIEGLALNILLEPNLNDSAGDKTRYKFNQGTAREKALNIIFDRAFKKDPAEIIKAAEQETQTIFYPTWKRVVWIQAPTLISQFINNPLIKIVLTVHFVYYSAVACHAAYRAVVKFTACSIPFIINNTPIQVIRLGNALLDLKDYTENNAFTILFYTWAAREIIVRGPEIRHVTPLARRISLWAVYRAIFHAPQTIFDFVWKTSIETAVFTWVTCANLGNSLRGRVNQYNDERLAICRAKSYDAWKALIMSHAQRA